MDEIYTQLRIRRSTNQKLRICGAMTSEKLIDLIDRLVSEELKKHGQNVQIQDVSKQEK